MTLPSLLLALLIASLYGALYHLWRDGGFWRLLLYLGLSVLGFTVGHLLGVWRGWVFIPFGSLNLGMSSVSSLLLLLVGDWFANIEAK
ncbi:MAG: hypothetical protein L6Q26_06140, partial [Anaerolineales bacterium]|nr:hypothetical protein [Anaerolineales bacterium]